MELIKMRRLADMSDMSMGSSKEIFFKKDWNKAKGLKQKATVLYNFGEQHIMPSWVYEKPNKQERQSLKGNNVFQDVIGFVTKEVKKDIKGVWK